jgi:pimeloyl-ACP methyl ester carboxylesterase
MIGLSAGLSYYEEDGPLVRLPITFVIGALLVGTVGCANCPRHAVNAVQVARLRGVVFAIDGAGGFGATSEALSDAVAASDTPLRVEAFDWSHGCGRILSDEIDYGHAREQGQRLAGIINAWRQNCPASEVYMVAHSAGSAVALAAAESLPANSVNRIVLLAPAISASYDLRPTLRCTRDGLDVFYSNRDWGYLGVGMALFGTADRRWGQPVAGRVGFSPCVEAVGDAGLYVKLCQHPWHPCVAWSGNQGGHYGSYQEGFLRAYVLPLLAAR